MKANEIMTGDYFRIAQTGKIIKIVAVDEPSGSVDYFDGNAGGLLTIGVEKIEPIPLTAEILEKNGLRKVTLDGGKGSKQDYYIDTHIVGYYNMDALTRVHASPIVYDIKQKWLYVDDKCLCRIDLMCPYVHTLQHALGLGGIDKEIKL